MNSEKEGSDNTKLLQTSYVDGPIMPEDPHDSDESDDLAGLADDLDVLELVQEERQVERDDGEQVNLVIPGEISE